MLWDEGLRNGYFSEICQNAGIGGDIVCQRIQNLRVFFGYRSLKDKKLILDIFLAGLFGHSRAKIGAVDSKNIYGGRALDDFKVGRAVLFRLRTGPFLVENCVENFWLFLASSPSETPSLSVSGSLASVFQRISSQSKRPSLSESGGGRSLLGAVVSSSDFGESEEL